MTYEVKQIYAELLSTMKKSTDAADELRRQIRANPQDTKRCELLQNAVNKEIERQDSIQKRLTKIEEGL